MRDQKRRPVTLLLVEDDDEDVVLIKRALSRNRVVANIHRVNDGQRAMDYLRKQGEFVDAPSPDLILLDLNLPGMDGREVLKACCEDHSLATIPIVVFTSSNDERDVLDCYRHKAKSFITKPIDLDEFREVLKEIGHYWFNIVTLPGHGNP